MRLAEIKAVPEKGALAPNHALLFSILQDVAAYRPDVVITPECFLDGYLSVEKYQVARPPVASTPRFRGHLP